jgi:PAS domain S-box-containing protein
MESSPQTPPHTPASRRPALAGAFFAALILAALLVRLGQWYETSLQREARREFRAELQHQAVALSDGVQARAGLLFGLEGFVQANRGNPALLDSRFDSVAAALLQGFTGVRNLAVAQGTVYHWVHPLSGNQAVLGLDLLLDPRPQVREDTRRALETRRPTLSGPYELRQGGLGLVARKAIFQGQQYWGLVALALDLPALLAEARLPERHDLYSLRNAERVFAGNPELERLEPVSVTVSLPEGAWILSAAPSGGWRSLTAAREQGFWAAGTVICLLLVSLVYLLLRRLALLRDNARLAERRSAAAEEQYRAMVEAMTDGILVFDPRGRIVTANPAAADMHGYGPGELAGRDGLEIVHPDSADVFRDFLARTGAGRTFHGEGRARRRDGSPLPVQVRGCPFTLNGRPHLLAMLRDVSERNRLRRERERVVQLSADLIAVVDFTGRFADLNPAWSATLGLPEGEIRSRSFLDFVHPEDREATRLAVLGLAGAGP